MPPTPCRRASMRARSAKAQSPSASPAVARSQIPAVSRDPREGRERRPRPRRRADAAVHVRARKDPGELAVPRPRKHVVGAAQLLQPLDGHERAGAPEHADAGMAVDAELEQHERQRLAVGDRTPHGAAEHPLELEVVAEPGLGVPAAELGEPALPTTARGHVAHGQHMAWRAAVVRNPSPRDRDVQPLAVPTAERQLSVELRRAARAPGARPRARAEARAARTETGVLHPRAPHARTRAARTGAG